MSPLKKVVYVGVYTEIMLMGGAIFLFSLLNFRTTDWKGVAFFSLLTITANYFGEIRIMRHRSIMTDVIFITAMAFLFGPAVSVLIGSVAFFIFCFLGNTNKRHLTGGKLAWNLAFAPFQAFLLSEVIYSGPRWLSKVMPSQLTLTFLEGQVSFYWLAAIFATGVDIFINGGIVSLMVSISTGKRFRDLLKSVVSIAPFNLLMICFGIVMGLVYRQFGPLPVLVLSSLVLLVQNGALNYSEVRDNQDFISAELDGVIKAIYTGVVATDENWEIVHFNPAAEELTGLRAKKAIGTRLVDSPLVKLLNLNPVLNLPEVADKADSIREVEAEFDGKYRRLAYRLMPYYSKKGEHLGFLLTLWDVTALKELAEAKEKVSRLSIFHQVAASMSHDMKNPLAIIRGYTELLGNLLKRPALGEGDLVEGRQVIKEILDQTDRMTGLLQEILMGARYQDFHLEQIDVVQLLEETTLVFRNSPDYSAVMWDLDLGARNFRVTPLIYAAREPLQRAFANIIVNALEAMPQGGVLTVSTTYLPTENNVNIYFSDTGMGIGPEELSMVFDPFYTTKERKSGLGLTVSSQVIQEAGGKIQITSVKGHGTTVVVTLPLNSETEVSRHGYAGAEVIPE